MNWCFALVVPLLIPCVSAGNDSWDDFTNNLATDLAPLITLFGEQLTKQFLSESISILDNFIFALAPLGILTAVVSVIRVCGNSSLRAFIGRAQEGPGNAENELLSCVSETTAELFNDAGISRVFGRPRILEVVTWEDKDPTTNEKSLVIGTLREALERDAWYSRHGEYNLYRREDLPELDIPNLSLNKGIRRKSKAWFYLAAILGCFLQTGVIIYSILIVFVYPESFKKNGKGVASYAFPLFLAGTVLLCTGMFLCAFIIERSSREYYFQPSKPSKIYWLQPGSQNVGDQVFGAFLGVSKGHDGQATKDLIYIKSKRDHGYNVKDGPLMSTVSLTMVGFIAQFVGLRGLHSSITLAQLGSTLVMAVVRTCLRTDRIDADENQLTNEERELTSHNQQELDCFAFHLANIDSFSVLSTFSDWAHTSRTTQSSLSTTTTTAVNSTGIVQLGSNAVRMRARLAELTSDSAKRRTLAWDDLPIRKVARDLAHAIESTMDILSSWRNMHDNSSSFTLTFGSQVIGCKSTPPLVEAYSIPLQRSGDTLRWKVDENQLEAVLGLWTWSLLKSDKIWPRRILGRIIGLTKTEASKEETDLYFHKWIFRQTESQMVSSEMVSASHQMFGYYSDDYPNDMDILVVKTENKLDRMTAQDIYIRFLNDALRGFGELGGDTDIRPGSQNTFYAHNTRIDELVHCFETSKLGSREDALLCIVPILRHRGMLPDLAADSTSIRKLVEECIQKGKWSDAFLIVRWFCERCDGDEFKRSLSQLGFLCRRAMLHTDPDIQKLGLAEVSKILQSDIRPKYVTKPRNLRPPTWMRSQSYCDWWKSFSSQLGCIIWHICKSKSDSASLRNLLESSGISENSVPTGKLNGSEHAAEGGKHALLQWLSKEDGMPLKNLDDPESLGTLLELAFDWACQNGCYFLLQWLLMSWLEAGANFADLLYRILLLATRRRCREAIQTMIRRGLNINLQDPLDGRTALIEMVFENNENGVQELLMNGAEVDGKALHGLTALMTAASEGNLAMVRLLFRHGAAVDARDDNGQTALLWATSTNQVEVAKFLLKNGADPEKAGYSGYTALATAASENHLEMLSLLLQQGAQVNVQVADGSTPLMLASRSNYSHAVKLLLEWGADIHKKDWDGETAVDLARSLEHREIILLLEEHLRPSEFAGQAGPSAEVTGRVSPKVSIIATS